MRSKTNDHDVADSPRRSAAERVADGAKGPSHHERAARSELLRAREIPAFTLGSARTDVRGWRVYSNDAELVGAVSSIFVDMHTKAVRYLGIALHDARTKSQNREVLVPIGSLSRPDDRQVVVVNALSRAQLLAAPRVSNRPVTRADEQATLTTYGMQPNPSAGVHDLYGTPNFEERRLFGEPAPRAALP